MINDSKGAYVWPEVWQNVHGDSGQLQIRWVGLACVSKAHTRLLFAADFVSHACVQADRRAYGNTSHNAILQ